MNKENNNQVNQNNKEVIVMNDNKVVAGATDNTEDKKFEKIERKVQENLKIIGQEVQEKIQEIKDKEFIEEQEDIMAEVKEHNDRYNKYIEELEQERQEGLAEMQERQQIEDNWNKIQIVLKNCPKCGIKVIRKDIDACYIVMEEVEQAFEANMQDTLRGIQEILGIKALSSEELIIELQLQLKKKDKEIAELKRKIKTNSKQKIKGEKKNG